MKEKIKKLRPLRNLLMVLLAINSIQEQILAEDVFNNTEKPATLQFFNKESGRSALLVVFDENREAELKIRGPLDIKIESKLQMTENLCRPIKYQTKCSVSLNYFSADVVLIWTKHPDAQKLGSSVKVAKVLNHKNGYEFTENNSLFEESFTGNFPGIKNTYPSMDTGDLYEGYAESKNEFSCNNWHWYHGQDSRPQELKFSQAITESQSENPETGANELRSSSVFENLHFKSDQNEGLFYSIPTEHNDILFPFGNSLTLLDEKGLCTQSFSVTNFPEITEAFIKFYNKQQSAPSRPFLSNRLPEHLINRVKKITSSSFKGAYQ